MQRKFTLLVVSILAMALVPLLVGERAQPQGLVGPDERLIGLLSGVVLVAAVHAVADRRRKVLVLATAALVVFGGRLASMFGEPLRYQYEVDASSYGMTALFMLATIVLVYRAILDIHKRKDIAMTKVTGSLTVKSALFHGRNGYSSIFHK